MQRLRPAEHGGKCLNRDPDDVVLRLLSCEADAGGLRMEAHQPGSLIFGSEVFFHLARPNSPGSPVLRDFLEEIIVRVEKEREPRTERIHVQSAIEAPTDILHAVNKRERQLLTRGRSRLADVVAGY